MTLDGLSFAGDGIFCLFLAEELAVLVLVLSGDLLSGYRATRQLGGWSDLRRACDLRRQG